MHSSLFTQWSIIIRALQTSCIAVVVISPVDGVTIVVVVAVHVCIVGIAVIVVTVNDNANAVIVSVVGVANVFIGVIAWVIIIYLYYL